MSTRNTNILMVLVVIAAFAAGCYFYPQMPLRVASHWNGMGQVNGTMDRFWGVFLLPLLIAMIAGLASVLPSIDPLRENVRQFRAVYNAVFVSLLLFMLYLYALTLVWNLGVTFDFIRALVPALGVLFIVIGVFLPRTRRNWFLGIRTPWTLSSDEVWNKTHRVSGVVFKVVGFVAIICGLLFPGWALLVMAAALLIAPLYAIAYSYRCFRIQQKRT